MQLTMVPGDLLTKRRFPLKKSNPRTFVPMNNETGKWIIVIGAIIILVGIVVYFFHDKLHWIGRLPGDIRIEKGNFRFYFPITTLIIISVLFTIIVNLVKRFLH